MHYILIAQQCMSSVHLINHPLLWLWQPEHIYLCMHYSAKNKCNKKQDKHEKMSNAARNTFLIHIVTINVVGMAKFLQSQILQPLCDMSIKQSYNSYCYSGAVVAAILQFWATS